MDPKAHKALLEAGFVEADSTLRPRLILSVEGLEKTGKTHLSLTAPDPITYFDIDLGSEGVVGKFKQNGREIYSLEVATPTVYRKGKAVEKVQVIEAATQVVEKVWKAWDAALVHSRTIVIDTASEFWELLRMARLGKLAQVMPENYAPVNAEFREFIRRAYDSDCNLILVHKHQKRYVRHKGADRGEWDGGYERKGFSDTGYLVQAMLQCSRDEDGEFHSQILDCRQNALLKGMDLAGEMNTFPMLASLVFPDTETSQWE